MPALLILHLHRREANCLHGSIFCLAILKAPLKQQGAKSTSKEQCRVLLCAAGSSDHGRSGVRWGRATGVGASADWTTATAVAASTSAAIAVGAATVGATTAGAVAIATSTRAPVAVTTTSPDDWSSCTDSDGGEG